MSFICLRIVDFPDSPAPVYVQLKHESIRTQPTEQEHLDLVSLRHLISFQLIFNFIIPCLAGRIFFTRTTPHLVGSRVLGRSEESRVYEE